MDYKKAFESLQKDYRELSKQEKVLRGLLRLARKDIDRLREKIKPFVEIYNLHFGTNLSIGNIEAEGSFNKYIVVESEKIEQQQAIINELIEELHHD